VNRQKDREELVKAQEESLQKFEQQEQARHAEYLAYQEKRDNGFMAGLPK